jgi:hypothetical protein
MWIGVAFIFFGWLSILSNLFGWRWWWWFTLNRGFYNLESIGERNAQRIHWVLGAVLVGTGFALLISDWFQLEAQWLLFITIPISSMLTYALYRARLRR